MKIVIVGCGRVGAQLATALHIEGHEVSIIDKNYRAFERLGKAYDGKKTIGIGYDRQTLIDAGIETADAFASVTNGDNTNIVSAIIARNFFRVPKVVTRIKDPERALVYRRFGIPTISPTTWGANEVRELLLYTGLTSRHTFGSGEVELMEIEVTPRLAGRMAKDLAVMAEIDVVCVTRAGRAFIPTAGTTFEQGDLVYLAVSTGGMPRLEAMLR